MRHFEPKQIEHDSLSMLAAMTLPLRDNALWLLENINGLAERDMLTGNPITGAHHRAIEKARAALRDGTVPELATEPKVP